MTSVGYLEVPKSVLEDAVGCQKFGILLAWLESQSLVCGARVGLH